MPAGWETGRAVEPVLLVGGPPAGRILILRIVPSATPMTVRPAVGAARPPSGQWLAWFPMLRHVSFLVGSWMRRTGFISGCGLALGGAILLAPATTFEILGQATFASTPTIGQRVTARPNNYPSPSVSSFAPRPVPASLSPLEVVLPPSPPIGNNPTATVPSRPIALRVASQQPIEVSGITRRNDGPVVPDYRALQYTPTTSELTSQLLPAVQRGYALAQRGALYAAQTEFVQVLRRVALAKDAARGGEEHSRALAAGLRALDEAKDFVPSGLELEGEVNVWIVSSSHRTPVLHEYANEVSLHMAGSLYHAFAERQLAFAVASEQSGSTALHGLGKINARLAELSDNNVHDGRIAVTMFSAAIAARPDNYLAANELGVLLCRNGRPAESVRLFERAIDFAPSALAYHNLAVAQRKLGMHGQAAANEQESQRLAAWERSTGAVSQRVGVHWVAPEDMAHVAQPSPLAPKGVVAEAQRKSPWRKTAELARSLPLPGRDRAAVEPRQAAEPRTPQPFVTAPLFGTPGIR
jgi:tetratricopeptide (TPR) repeat protein